MTTSVAPRASAPPRHRFTVAEYYAMADVGILAENDRVELLDGDIIAMPPIGDWHQSSVDCFTNLMSPLLRGRATMRVQGPTRLNDNSELLPRRYVAAVAGRLLSGRAPRTGGRVAAY